MFPGTIAVDSVLDARVRLTKEALAAALKAAALRMSDYGEGFDDFGNNWYTYHGKEGKAFTFIGDAYRPITTTAETAHLIDSMNILLYGRKLVLEQEDAEERLEDHRKDL